jgi:RNA polymerase sigma factor (sigma-70 family)
MKGAQSLVFVVDDDLSVREALSSLIRSVGLHVETYASASEFLERLRQPVLVPACVVLDVRMPDMSGLDLQRELGGVEGPLPIIFITGHGDIPMTVRAIKAGAVEFLPKPFRDQDLLDAITLSLQLAEDTRREHEASEGVRARFETLTAREREVLGLIVQGLRNKQTADRLGISEVTVKVHRHNIMEKMKASSMPALIAMLDRLRFPSGDAARG